MQFHEIGREARNLYASFIESVDEYRPALWRFCMKLTSNVWDAEDLLQETLMKAFVAMGQIKHPIMPKSYLFRIASNAWIDHQRKVRPDAVYDSQVHDVRAVDWGDRGDRRLEVIEGIEVLLRSLTPRQAVVMLLVDVFDFTANEVGEMMQMTGGAVQTMVSRARAKLRSLSSEQSPDGGSAAQSKSRERFELLVLRYVDAIHQQDIDGLMDLYAEHAEIHFLNAGIVRGHDLIRNTYDWSIYPDAYRTEFRWIWGQPALLTIAIRGDAESLWRVQRPEFEDGQVVREKNYAFCKEVMLAVSHEIGLPVDPETRKDYEQVWKALLYCPN